MNIKIGRTLFALMTVALFAAITVSCDKDDDVDRTCKVALVTRVNPNTVGDTVYRDVQAGEFLLDVEDPVKPGFTFGGWFTDSGTADTKTGDPKFPAYDLKNKPIYLNTILYARWLNQ